MRETFDAEALVKDVRPAVFFALLKYLYSDTLELERPQDIMELLVVANQVLKTMISILVPGSHVYEWIPFYFLAFHCLIASCG